MKLNNSSALVVALTVATTAAATGATGCGLESSERASCEGSATAQTTVYRFTQAKLPRNHFQAVLTSRDYNGDGKQDNQLGVASVAMVQLAAEYDPGAAMAARLQALPAASAWTLQLTQCREHAGGDAALIHDGISEPATAVLNGSKWIITGNDLTVPVAWLADSVGAASAPGWLATDAAELVVTMRGNTMQGRFAATVEPTAVRALIVPPLLMFLNQPARSSWLRFLLDTDGNGTITAAELQASSGFNDLTKADIAVASGDAPTLASVGLEIEAVQIQ